MRLAESMRFPLQGGFITADLDLDHLRQERMRWTTFGDCVQAHREQLEGYRRIEIELDGKPLHKSVTPPSGLSRDGTSTTHQRFEVPAGEHTLSVKMNDSVRHEGYNYVREEKLVLKPAQIVVIDFSADKGGIFFAQ